MQIGGDVTGLNKALSGVNKEIKSTQTQLKDVERLLKLDPKNTELLKQKQNLLAQAVGETGQKLTSLKQAEQQVQAQMAQGKASQEQYNALKREIIATEESLKSLEKQQQKTNSVMTKISGAAGAVSDKTQKAAQKTAPLTMGVVAAGTAAVAAMNNVDDGLDLVMTKTGATGQAAKDLQMVYNNVATTVPASFGDIGAAVGEVNTRLGFTGGELEKASTQFLKFAKINGTDVESSVQLVTRAMGDAGINASEYGAVLDALTVAGQKSGISMDTLATNLAKYGAPMRALGIDTQTAIAMFAGWEKAGVNTETAFSGMKKAISTWAAAGKDSTKEFEKTLKAIESAPDIASATTKAIEVFGTKAGPDLADAIKGGRFEVDEYVKALQDAGGTVDETYGMIVDEVDDTQLAMQTAQVAVHDIGETLAKTLGPKLKDIAGGIKDVCDWFGKLDGKSQNTILVIIGVVAAISPLLGLISKISKGVSFLTSTVIPGVSKALGFLAANPIVILIAAIVGLVAIIATKGDEIQAVFQKIDEFIQNIFLIDWSESLGEVGNIVNALFANIRDAWEVGKSIFNGIIDFIRGVFTGDWERAWEGVKSIFKGIFDGLALIVKAPLNLIFGMLNGAIDGLNKIINGIKKIPGTDWIPTIPKIPYLANGGVLYQGSAVVGEAGPELLTMAGNRAVVQPLGSGGTTNNTNLGGVTMNIYGAPGQDVNQLADVVADKLQRATVRRGAVWA